MSMNACRHRAYPLGKRRARSCLTARLVDRVPLHAVGRRVLEPSCRPWPDRLLLHNRLSPRFTSASASLLPRRSPAIGCVPKNRASSRRSDLARR
eukprot:scaffold234439_cov29-Tisochrysis_lutea.AAC.3